jgi:hypothetical protein
MTGEVITVQADGKIPNPSNKRYIIAALVGFLVGNIIARVVDIVIPGIIGELLGINKSLATSAYNGQFWFDLNVMGLSALISAICAGFIARNKGWMVGLLANVIGIIPFGYMYFSAQGVGKEIAGLDFQTYNLLIFGLVFVSSIIGGLFGERVNQDNPGLDIDNGQKQAVWGVRWYHFIWMQYVIGSYAQAAIMLTYALILTLTTVFFRFVSLSFFNGQMFVYLMVGLLSILGIGLSFNLLHSFWTRFIERQLAETWIGKLVKILWYGLIVPYGILMGGSYFITVVNAIHKSHPYFDWNINYHVLIPSLFLTSVLYIFVINYVLGFKMQNLREKVAVFYSSTAVISGCFSMNLAGLLGFGLYVWSIGIAFQLNGLISACVTAFFPVFSQIYWFFVLWGKTGNVLNPYGLSIVLYLVLWVTAIWSSSLVSKKWV